MTRWARSKSVLKHERQPGEATTWSEFVSQRQQATKPRFARLDDTGANTKLLNTEKELSESSNLAVKKKLSSSGSTGAESSTDRQGVTGDAVHLKKAAVTSNKPSQDINENYSNLKAKGQNAAKRKVVSAHDEEGEALNKLMLKHRKTNAGSPAKDEGKSGSSVPDRGAAVPKEEALLVIENVEDNEGEEGQRVSKVPRTGPHVDGGGSCKAKRLQRMRKQREAKGLLLLPEKVERRIYLTKKSMRKKGIPGEQIKEAVRKMRRKEELLFRRQLAKLCFKCRQPGHRVSDCPQMLQDSSEPIGICFKCGSTEHFSSACTVQTSKDNEFPYAKCFICKQQGHLSRKCPRNDKGVYPKGGHCNFCGAIDHFKKEYAENIVPLHQGVQLKKEKVVSF
ncbi:hypothetical protein MRX96_055646 [Rhipicephalus microplus]